MKIVILFMIVFLAISIMLFINFPGLLSVASGGYLKGSGDENSVRFTCWYCQYGQQLSAGESSINFGIQSPYKPYAELAQNMEVTNAVVTVRCTNYYAPGGPEQVYLEFNNCGNPYLGYSNDWYIDCYITQGSVFTTFDDCRFSADITYTKTQAECTTDQECRSKYQNCDAICSDGKCFIPFLYHAPKTCPDGTVLEWQGYPICGYPDCPAENLITKLWYVIVGIIVGAVVIIIYWYKIK